MFIVLITKSYDKSVWCNFSVHCQSKKVQQKKQGKPIVYLRKKYRKEILINGNNSISKLITQ